MNPNATPLTHPGATADCNDCGGSGHVVRSQGEFSVGALCTCVMTCPICNDSGFEAPPKGQRRGRRKRCVCRRLRGRLARYTAAKVPARYAHCTLLSFERTADTMKPFTRVAHYLKSYQPKHVNRGLVLHGDVGRGKTHLMAAIVRDQVIQHGVSARFIEFSHLIADLKYSFDRGSGAAALIDPLVHVDVLAIDELGKGRNTEWEGTILDELISRRYNAYGTVLATSNYPPGPATGRAAPNHAKPEQRPALVDRIGPRVYSRLFEMCEFVEMGGADYRNKLATQATSRWARARRR